MKILVTGGAGFIGSNLVRHLLAASSPASASAPAAPLAPRPSPLAPHDVLNVDALTYAGNRHSLADLEGNPHYRFAHADICDTAALTPLFAEFQPDWVMHLAAESHVDRSIDGPGAFIQTNITGTYTLLQAARAHFETLTGPARDRFRFLHVSTDEVYGSLGATGLFNEETPYDPHSPYSASKAASDHLARAWADTYKLPVLVTNCSNNYGPYQFPEKLIPVVILKALRGDPIPIYGQGNNVRDWLYVGDHAAALHTVIANGRVGQTYNIGGNNERQNIDLVRLLCGLLDELRPRADGQSYAGQITYVADRPGHDLRYAIDATKIRRELGWTPKQDHTSGFRQTVQWYLENQSWWQTILDGSYRLQRLGVAAAKGEGQ